MGIACQHDHHDHDHDHGAVANTPRYRRVLWAALVINLALFFIEVGSSWRSGSVALLADSADFFADAANFAISLAVLGASLALRSRAAWWKAASMGALGLAVLGRAGWSAWAGEPPQAMTMGLVGLLALAANGTVVLLLYAFREGDANMRSVWLCSRNDAIGNLAVMGAALGVAGTGTRWPDLLVAGVMGGLAVHSAWTVMRHARQEMSGTPVPQASHHHAHDHGHHHHH